MFFSSMVTPAKKLEQRWLHAGEKLFGYGRCRKLQKEMKGLVQDLEYEKMYFWQSPLLCFWVFFVHIFSFPQGLWDFWVFMVNLTADPTVDLRSFLSYRRTDARRKNTATTHVTCRSKFVFKKRDSTIQLWYTWMMRLTLVFSMLLHPRIFYDFHIQGF